MTSIIKTVSLTPEEVDFLEINNISPTALLKSKIDEIKTFRAKPLLDKIDRLLEQMHKYTEFLEKKGLIDEFLKE